MCFVHLRKRNAPFGTKRCATKQNVRYEMCYETKGASRDCNAKWCTFCMGFAFFFWFACCNCLSFFWVLFFFWFSFVFSFGFCFFFWLYMCISVYTFNSICYEVLTERGVVLGTMLEVRARQYICMYVCMYVGR